MDEQMWRLKGQQLGLPCPPFAPWPFRLPLVCLVRAGWHAGRNWTWTVESSWRMFGIARGWI